MSMKIKPGYKQTEVGVIPEDWEALEIQSIIAPGKKYGIIDGPFGSNLKTIHYRKSGIPIITSGYVTEGKFLADTYFFIDKEKFEQEKRSAVYAGEIVMAKIGARCGASAVLPLNHKPGILSGNALKISVDIKKHVAYFIWQVLWNLYTKGDLDSVKTVGAQPAISIANLKKYKIPIPPISEQQAISTALSDTDALIESLEQLIAKKRLIKQGAMQELLRPKERWVKNRLGDCAVLKARIGWQGLTTDEYLNSGNFHLVTGTDFKNGSIDWENCYYVDELRYKQDKYIQLKEGDVLVTKDGTIGKVALVKYLFLPATLNSGVFVIRPVNRMFHSIFFYYILHSHVFNDFLNQLCAGSTINHLYQKDFVNFIFEAPPTIKEQSVIATILTDIDTEITALETKLTKIKQIKQGMMHNLLTGRIRLV